VNNRDKNFTRAKMDRRLAQIEESVARYLHQFDSADQQEPSLARDSKTTRLKEKIAKLKVEVRRLRSAGFDPRAFWVFLAAVYIAGCDRFTRQALQKGTPYALVQTIARRRCSRTAKHIVAPSKRNESSPFCRNNS
jgi:hypothetical protein